MKKTSRAESCYPRFGEQMDRLVYALVANKNWIVRKAVAHIADRVGYSTDSVYRWRRGERYPRQEEVLELLAKIGKEAGLDRVWGESFLRAGRHPFAIRVIEDVWGIQGHRPLQAGQETTDAARLFEAIISLASQQTGQPARSFS